MKYREFKKTVQKRLCDSSSSSSSSLSSLHTIVVIILIIKQNSGEKNEINGIKCILIESIKIELPCEIVWILSQLTRFEFVLPLTINN